MSTKKGKAKPILKRNDQGMPGWNVYCGLDFDFSKITFYPEAGTFYFEIKPRSEGEKYFGIRPGPGRKHPDDEVKLCPKCRSGEYYLHPHGYKSMPFEQPTHWHCHKCGHSEKVKP